MSDRLFSKIMNHRRMSNIDRMSISYKQRKYSLAEHSYYVAVMFEDFAKEECLSYSVKDMYMVLRHDLLETLTTDLINPVKTLSEATRESWDTIEKEVTERRGYVTDFSALTDKELKEKMDPILYCLMKDCDMLELFLFCLEEYILGNSYLDVKEVIWYTGKELLESSFKSIQWFVDYIIRGYKLDFKGIFE